MKPFIGRQLNTIHPDRILLSWFNAGWRMLYKTQAMTGATTNSSSSPLLSLEEDAASAIKANSLAEALSSDMSPAAAKPPPIPRPTMIPLLLIRLSWLRAGWSMLKRTQTMAGMMGNRRAMPQLSPSVTSAICRAAKAASVEPRVENIAPAIAAAAPILEMWGGLEIERRLGRL